MLTRWALAAAVMALIALGGWGLSLDRAADRLEARAESAERELHTAREMLVQAREAQRVANMEAERQRARAAEYDRLREGLLQGGHDEQAPDWLRDYVRSLLQRPGR